MKWTASNNKLSASVHVHTPQIAITHGSNNNMLLGYLNVCADRPVSIKSIKISFSGVYSAFWIEGTGQNKLEYYQNKEFIAEYLSITKQHLVVEGKRDGVVARAAGEFQRDPLGTGAVIPDWDESPSLSRSSSRSDDDVGRGLWGNDSAVTLAPPPFDYTDAPQDDKPGFELDAGKHRFEFALMLPAKMPSTVVSKVGGIEYTLNACIKTKNTLGMSGYLRSHRPVHVVNLPARLSDPALPVNDEAVFTKQVDEGWWAMARLSTRTASPGDAIQVSTCLSWPGKCGYEEGVREHLELVGVQIEMTEVTVYRSLTTGATLKRIEVPVASTSSNGLARASNESARCATSADIVHSAVSESSGLKMAYEYRAAPMRYEMPVAAQGLFNEEHRHEYTLLLPGARDTSSKARGEGTGILTDSRSAPVSVTHELVIKLQVLDKCAQKLHTIPFKSRVVVVPEASAFYLPAYSASMQDVRVM
ncbi:hypothetical protein GGI01_003163 [Coemansia sp. RSA 376]|nr:hypothetical protein GGI14_001841 [Coemansia sp. S680]KAJ2040826.1 hypothetical protein H4S03_000771 [Coemansia sp. S3946]KAJ2114820.1 hypothetical protein IW146_002784 [Coemansia sp. RSA 922]KAJ2260180.1 hypothetical protein GGI01_003163 [Coemansia sp. RSA 376]